MRRRISIPQAALLSTLLLLAGCVAVSRLFGQERYAFSHALHVGEEQLDCFSCHETALMDDDPGMPVLDSCEVCHDEFDEEQPPERRVASLFAGDEYLRSRVGGLGEEVLFSHKAHTGYEESCSACHTGIEENHALSTADDILMADCTACHEARAAPAACEDCHREIDEDWEPLAHRQNWLPTHGSLVHGEFPGASNDCSLCHAESTCTQCHLEEPPRNHNNYFRLSGHGLLASLDRASCAYCHRRDSCEACHMEVLPRSHAGSFGGTQSNHCITCHFPLQTEGCITCHKGTPSHLSTPKPPGHNPAMNCRTCHNGVEAAMPHAEKGDDCNLCHL